MLGICFLFGVMVSRNPNNLNGGPNFGVSFMSKDSDNLFFNLQIIRTSFPTINI